MGKRNRHLDYPAMIDKAKWKLWEALRTECSCDDHRAKQRRLMVEALAALDRPPGA